MEYFLSTCCGLLLRQPPVEVHPEEVDDLVLAASLHQIVSGLHLEVQGLVVVEGRGLGPVGHLLLHTGVGLPQLKSIAGHLLKFSPPSSSLGSSHRLLALRRKALA